MLADYMETKFKESRAKSKESTLCFLCGEGGCDKKGRKKNGRGTIMLSAATERVLAFPLFPLLFFSRISLREH
jgi:hypothetical protein